MASEQAPSEQEILDAINRDHGGLKRKRVEYVTVSNPNYSIGRDPRSTIRVKVTKYEAHDKFSFSVREDPPAAPEEPPPPPYVHEQGYETPDEKPAVDNRTAEAKSLDAQRETERRNNQAATGEYETNAERREREAAERKEAESAAARQRADDAQARQDRIAEATIANNNRSQDRADRTEERQIDQQAETNQLTRERYQFDREKYEDDRRKPQFMGSPTDTTRNIAYFNPSTGAVETAPNPMYDEAKVEAQRLKEQLSIGIQLNEITAKQASEQYSRWFKENIEVPYLQSAEARAQAADKRQALEAEERRRQFAAQNSLQRGELGQRAAATAIGAEMDMLPYRAGPTFDAEMGAAINSLGAGGSMDKNASAGINFSPGAFSFDKPDLGKIARDATKNALKNVSTYQPSDEDFGTGDYSGINLPNAGTFAGAPQAAPGIDLTGAYNQFIGQYGGPPPE